MATTSMSRADADTAGRRVDFTAFGSGEFDDGDRNEHVSLDGDGHGAALTLRDAATEGTWTSPWHQPGFPVIYLVPSWRAETPPGTWVEFAVQVRTATTESGWFPAGMWAFHDDAHRKSVREHRDDLGVFVTDTFTAPSDQPGAELDGYRLRAMLRGDGQSTPVLRQLAASAAAPGRLPSSTSEPLLGTHTELAVPGLSQSTHRGEYADFGGGGQVWCSPTSVAMVTQYWGAGPTDDELAHLPADDVFEAHDRRDPQVPWAAIHTWDPTYRGTGNWSFSTAYASHYGLDGSVRHYSSLRDVERWIDDGVPVVASIRWDNDADEPLVNLDGAGVEHSNGHLLVVAGFTSDGDVIACDPAAPDNDHVRRTYRRDQFEHNWLRGSHGITYILKPARE